MQRDLVHHEREIQEGKERFQTDYIYQKNPTQIDTPISQTSEDSTTIHHAESLRGITDLSNPINTKDQHSQWD